MPFPYSHIIRYNATDRQQCLLYFFHHYTFVSCTYNSHIHLMLRKKRRIKKAPHEYPPGKKTLNQNVDHRLHRQFTSEEQRAPGVSLLTLRTSAWVSIWWWWWWWFWWRWCRQRLCIYRFYAAGTLFMFSSCVRGCASSFILYRYTTRLMRFREQRTLCFCWPSW